MVMQVEVRQGNDSFLSLDEDVQVVLVETNSRDNNKTPEIVNGRDDSTCCGRDDGSLDNTRQTISTFSILDLTKDEEDDDDDDDDDEEQSHSLLFEELQSIHPSSASPSVVAAPAFQIPYLKTVTDSFVDSLCHGPSPTCALLPAACYTTPSTSSTNSCPSSTSSSNKPYWQHAPQDRLQVGFDVWELLGCANPTTASEAYWTTSIFSSNLLQQLAVPVPPPSNKPIRASRQQRKNQLERWKEQQQLRLIQDPHPTRHGRTATASPTSTIISKAYTMDDMMHHQQHHHQHPSSSDHHHHHPLAHVIGGKGIDPILPADGYDSDPEFSFDHGAGQNASASAHSSSLMDNDDEEEEGLDLMDAQSEDERIHQIVQVRRLQFNSCGYAYIHT